MKLAQLKFRHIFSLLFIVFSLLTPVFACFPVPYYITHGLSSSDILLVPVYENPNPYFATSLVLACPPYFASENIIETQLKTYTDNKLQFSEVNSLCVYGQLQLANIQSVKLNGQEVNYIKTETKTTYFIWDGYLPEDIDDYAKGAAIRIDNLMLFNGRQNTLSINGHDFKFSYVEGVVPYWELSLFAIFLGIFTLLLKGKRSKRVALVASLLTAIASLVFVQFDANDICQGHDSPNFLLVGGFLSGFMLLQLANFVHWPKFEHKKRLPLFIAYLLLAVVYYLLCREILSSWWIS